MLFLYFLFCLSLSFRLSLHLYLSLCFSERLIGSTMYLNLRWPLASTTHLSIMQHKYTHKHTHAWLYSSQSHSFSLSLIFLLSVWLSVWPARGNNSLLWRCCVWLSLPACHIHLEREGKGKLGGVWRQWARKTHTAFPAHVVWVNSVYVCVCVCMF